MPTAWPPHYRSRSAKFRIHLTGNPLILWDDFLVPAVICICPSSYNTELDTDLPQTSLQEVKPIDRPALFTAYLSYRAGLSPRGSKWESFEHARTCHWFPRPPNSHFLDLTTAGALAWSLALTLHRNSRPGSMSDPESGSPPGPVLVDKPSRVRPRGRGLSVLCFDGGGNRGYSSLLMLKRLLRGIVPESEGPVYPYRYFDLICGTSTGGLIAIMLSVLQLDIDTAISCYKLSMSREGRQGWWSWGQDSRHTLTTAMQEALKEHGCDNRLMISSGHDKGCKCFVTATATIKGEGLRVEPTVRLIRSYEVSPEKSPPWTVLDAALATTAAPALFRNHTITHENVTYQFEDAGVHGLSNPTIIAWDECDRIDPITTPYCVVSLGTGLNRNPTIETDKPASYWLLAAVLAYMPFTGTTGSQKASASRDVRDIDEKMIRLTRKMDPNPYFRFDPDIDTAGNLSPSGIKATPLMDHDVYNYIDKNGPMFDRCSRRLAS